MKSVMLILQVLCMIFVPLLIIKFRNNRVTKFIGTIGMAYLFGIFFHLQFF